MSMADPISTFAIWFYRLLIAIKHALPYWPLVDFRKESSENGLRTLPASHYSQAHSGIEDYESEAKMTLRFSGTLDDLYEGCMAQ